MKRKLEQIIQKVSSKTKLGNGKQGLGVSKNRYDGCPLHFTNHRLNPW